MAFSDLSERFGTVVWAPGNHELWTHPDDKVQLRGEERYRHLVRLCRSLGVLTPEDPYPVWDGVDGPVTVAPLRLHISPHGNVSREDWCRARVELTQRRLEARDPELPVVLVNHFPLIREPTQVLRYPEFAQ